MKESPKKLLNNGNGELYRVEGRKASGGGWNVSPKS
jgi:hypothetical protein